MSSRNICTRILLLQLVFLSPFASGSEVVPDKKVVLRIAVVPQFEQTRIQQIWIPIVDKLKQSTNLELTLIRVQSIPEFEQRFISEEFDIAYVNPYHYFVARRNYVPLVRDVEKQLFGILVVKKDSPIQSPKELKNKNIAFPSANALGASLMIRSLLADQYQLQFTPMYVKSHDSVFLNVIGGFADAGGAIQRTLEKQPALVQSQLRTIAESRKVPSHPIVSHRKVPEAIRAKIVDALLEMGADAQGGKLLSEIPITRIGRAKSSDYDVLSDMNLERFAVQGQP